MFANALLFDRPFRHFLCFDSFPAGTVAEMRRAVASPLPWGVRIGSFYETRRLDLRKHLLATRKPPRFVSALFLARMRLRLHELFGEPLSDEVQVLGHRMLPGQSIGIHNDNPGLGYENYRVIVQLTTRHREEHGGALNLHLDDGSERVFQRIRPCYNMSVGFEASHASYHSVEPVIGRVRDALLFNFWHAGNSPGVERSVYAVLNGIWREEYETHPDSGLVAAACAAELLRRWGYPETVASQGAVAALGSSTAPDAEHEARRRRISAGAAATDDSPDVEAAVRLAVWIARAPRRTFNRFAWRAAGDKVRPLRDRLPHSARRAADDILFRIPSGEPAAPVE